MQSKNIEREKEQGEKANQGTVMTAMHLMKCINNNLGEELDKILEMETCSKVTLNSALQKALQLYKSSGDMINIVDSLLK